MSLPHFPENVLDITCEQAFNMLLGSIAMEELALSHIMNAEGEKLQYMLGTLSEKPCPSATPKEILEVNRSIGDLLEKVAYNQILLKGKLQQVLEARDQCCPPEPPCPHTQVCMCIWTAEPDGWWRCAHPVSWCKDCEKGKTLCWQKCAPTSLSLCTQDTVFLYFSFQVHAGEPVLISIVLREAQSCKDILICECCAPDGEQTVTVSGSTVLSQSCGKVLQFVLESPQAVWLEQGKLTIVAAEG